MVVSSSCSEAKCIFSARSVLFGKLNEILLIHVAIYRCSYLLEAK